MLLSHNLTAGTDPEVILQSQDTGHLVSAIGLIPGSKYEPFPVSNGAIHVDNVLAEFNTVPATSIGMFDSVVENVFDQLNEMLRPDRITHSRASVGMFDESELSGDQAWIAGCDPDWNAHTLQLNDVPALTTTMRSAGGHVHFGVDIPMDDLPVAVRCADLLIAIPMLVVDDKRRRTLYGQAGSFRVKDYGFEYRTPSNHWIFHTASRRWMYDRMCEVVDRYKEIDLPPELASIIDTHDLQKAIDIMQAYDLVSYPTGH